jgi:DNA-binding transcriptional ArsR family regulator
MIVEVDHAPAYELLVSFGIFVSRKHLPDIELGPAWLRQVRQRVSAAFEKEIAKLGVKPCKHMGGLLVTLVRQAPGERDAPGFLEWLGRAPTGELYERLAPTVPVGDPPLPRDLGAQRDQWVAALSTWNERYVSQLDPALLSGLADDAAEKRAMLERLPAAEVVELATNGIVVELKHGRPAVTLVPQYHQSPLNDVTTEHERVIFMYPADVLPRPPGAPPRELLRLTRGLCDESRLRMLRTLSDDSCTLTELAREVGLSQSTIHHHLLLLRASGLVRFHFGEQGTKRYSLRRHALEQLGAQLGLFLRQPAQKKGGRRR